MINKMTSPDSEAELHKQITTQTQNDTLSINKPSTVQSQPFDPINQEIIGICDDNERAFGPQTQTKLVLGISNYYSKEIENKNSKIEQLEKENKDLLIENTELKTKLNQEPTTHFLFDILLTIGGGIFGFSLKNPFDITFFGSLSFIILIVILKFIWLKREK